MSYRDIIPSVVWLLVCFAVAMATACGASVQAAPTTVAELVREFPEPAPATHPAHVEWVVDGNQSARVPVRPAPITIFGAANEEELREALELADAEEMGCRRATTGDREAWVCMP